MDKTELIKGYNLRAKDIKSIFELHKSGLSAHEIEWKVRFGESYIVYCLKKGKDEVLAEVRKYYGLSEEDVGIKKNEEKSSQKTIEKSEQAFLCMDCNKILKQIDSLVYNGYTFRMYQCPKCKKGYPHPIDSQNYLYEVNK